MNKSLSHRRPSLLKFLAWAMTMSNFIGTDTSVFAQQISQQCLDQTIAVLNTTLIQNAFDTPGNCISSGNTLTCDYAEKTAAIQAVCTAAGGTFYETNDSLTCATYNSNPVTTSISYANYGLCVGTSCSESEFEAIAIIIHKNSLKQNGYESCEASTGTTAPPAVTHTTPPTPDQHTSSDISQQCAGETDDVMNTPSIQTASAVLGECSTSGNTMTCDYSNKAAAIKAVCTSAGGIFYESNDYLTCGTYNSNPVTTSISYVNYGLCIGPSCTESEFEAIATTRHENTLQTKGYESCQADSTSVFVTPSPQATNTQPPNNIRTFPPTTRPSKRIFPDSTSGGIRSKRAAGMASVICLLTAIFGMFAGCTALVL